jgi:hypothetical protein
MLKIVRLALTRPYTFIVLAMLIVLIGPLAALRTPTDIFPDIRIPVISVIWNYAGLQPDDMSGRIVTYYERTLGTTVNDVEHIESQSFAVTASSRYSSSRRRHPDRDCSGHLGLADRAQADAARHYAAADPELQRVDGAGPADRAHQQHARRTEARRLRDQLHSSGAAERAWRGDSDAVRRQDARSADRPGPARALQARPAVRQTWPNALAQQNQIVPAGTEKIGDFEYNIKLNNSPLALDELNNLPDQGVNGATIYIRDVATCARRQSAAEQYRASRRPPRGADVGILKNGSASTLDIIAGVKASADSRRLAARPQARHRSATSRIRAGAGQRRGARRRDRRRADQPDDPAVPRQLALHADHRDLDSARHARLDRTLSAIGETLNIMTLGGLALAVGILVDDATVTIENINWHLEQGKEVRRRDPRRRRADRDAGVRLAAVYLHCVRADVLPRRRRTLPVRADGRGRDLRDDRLVHPVTNASCR